MRAEHLQYIFVALAFLWIVVEAFVILFDAAGHLSSNELVIKKLFRFAKKHPLLVIHFMLLFVVYWMGWGGIIMNFIVYNWEFSFGIGSVILICIGYLFSERSRRYESDYFGINTRLAKFPIKDILWPALSNVMPLFFIIATLPLFFATQGFDLTFIAISSTTSFLAIFFMLFDFWLKSSFKQKIILIALAIIVSIAISFFYNSIFLIFVSLPFIKACYTLSTGYYANGSNKDFAVVSFEGNNYIVAMKSADLLWILVRCTVKNKYQKIFFYKSDYILKSLEGLKIQSLNGFDLKEHKQKA